MLCTGSDVAVRRQMGRKGGHSRRAHFIGVTLAMQRNVPLDPVQIGLLSPDAVVTHTYRVPHLFKKRRLIFTHLNSLFFPQYTHVYLQRVNPADSEHSAFFGHAFGISTPKSLSEIGAAELSVKRRIWRMR